MCEIIKPETKPQPLWETEFSIPREVDKEYPHNQVQTKGLPEFVISQATSEKQPLKPNLTLRLFVGL